MQIIKFWRERYFYKVLIVVIGLGIHFSGLAAIKLMNDGKSLLAGPTSWNDSAITCMGNPVNINILANDFVVNPATSLDSTSVNLGPGNGKSVSLPSGNFVADPNSGLITFYPTTGFIGNVTVGYTVKDNLGAVSGTAIILVRVQSIPSSYSLTGGGNYCQGTFAGVGVGLSGSDLGVNYQLLINGVNSGAPLPGTGSPLYFGSQTTVGNYRVQATNPVTGCSVIMNSSASVNSIPPPTAYTVGGGGLGCNAGSGALVTLSGSDLGVNYQLQNGSILVGIPMAGTGGALTFPPVNGTSGNYIVTATNTSTSCTATMNGSVLVTIMASPTQYTVSGINLCGGYLSNDIKLSGSQIGITYQLLLNGSPLGAPVNGTGFALHFLGDTASGTYRVLATNATGCFSTMRNGAVISPSPIVYSLSPKIQHYCASGSGPTIILSNSDFGVNYQLFSSGIPVGSTVSGTGSALVYGPLSSGSYQVIASNASSGCSALPTDTVQIIADSIPQAFTLNPTLGHYCTGGLGVPIQLSGSQTGVNYQLYYFNTPAGTIRAGDGKPINFGYFPEGSYHVSASLSKLICTSILSDTVVIIQDSLPHVFPLSPDSAHYCINGTGVDIVLLKSESGVNYQLLRNGIPKGPGIPGTGGAIFMGSQLAGTYSVIALNTATFCGNTMANSSFIVADSLPKAFSLNPVNSSYCSGTGGNTLVLSGSQLGISYQLRVGNNPVGSPVTGTGGTISFGPLTSGSYSVLAQNPKLGCWASSQDTATIVKDSLPVIYVLNPVSAHYCMGDTGIHLSLSGSEPGVNYQVLLGGIPQGSPLAGTGNPLDLGLYKSGSYMVSATKKISGCGTQTNAAVLIADSTLKSFKLNPINSHYCSGNGIDISLSGSELGVNYQLFSGSNPMGGSIAGTGGLLDFGIRPSGMYTVQGVHTLGTCQALISNISTLIQDSLPTNFSLTGNSEYCPGTGGSTLTLSGSEIGISYQLQNSSGAVGVIQLGSGAKLIFSNNPTGSYLVVATSSGGCTRTMNSGIPFGVGVPLSAIITSHKTGCATIPFGSLKLSITGGTAPYSIIWSNGKTDTLISGLTAGNYSVTLQDQSGCSLSLSGTVSNSISPLASDIVATTPLNTNLTVNLITYVMAKDTSLNFKTVDIDPATPGIQNSIQVLGKGQFMVDSAGKITFIPSSQFSGIVSTLYSIQDRNGCTSDTAKIQITVSSALKADSSLEFPTLFTPNGDGYNDTFKINRLENYPNNTLEIFNRWGNQLFFGQGYLSKVPAWDGKGIGDGTYFYILKVEIGGLWKTYSGYIVLIRSGK